MFSRFGVKNLTMDDIAKELGMSKKTIYQHVNNKADLVRLSLEEFLKEEKANLKAILASTENSVDTIIQLVSYFHGQIREFNPYVLNDLQKYYPDCWAILNDYRYSYFHKVIADNIDNGIREGLYRKDMNADIISKIYIKGFEILLDQDLFPQKKYVFLEVYKEFLKYHLRGIVSAEGLKLLETHNIFKS